MEHHHSDQWPHGADEGDGATMFTIVSVPLP